MRRLGTALLLTLAASLLAAGMAAAHPLGNFSVNRYSRVEVARDELRLRYVLDLAEIPTLQELRAAGIQPGVVDDAARQALLATKATDLAGGAQLTLDGRPIAWTVQEASLDLLPGQADLDTLRVGLTLTAPVAIADGSHLAYRDTNYAGRVGWHEVVLRGGRGIDLLEATAPTVDRTNELREYPAEAERGPVDVSAATATLRWGVGLGDSTTTGALGEAATTARFGLDTRADQLAALLRDGATTNPWTLFLALLVAVGLGALHALEPGHGKTVVGGYLVGSRGTAKQAVLLGLTVTVTHTLGVYALGLVTLVAAHYVLPQRLYPILGVASGLMVVVIGLSLAWARLRALLPAASPPRPASAPVTAAEMHWHEHDHPGAPDTHELLHQHVHGDHHVHGASHSHEHDHGHLQPHEYDHGHLHEYDPAVPHRHEHRTEYALAHAASAAHHGPAHDHAHVHAFDKNNICAHVPASAQVDAGAHVHPHENGLVLAASHVHAHDSVPSLAADHIHEQGLDHAVGTGHGRTHVVGLTPASDPDLGHIHRGGHDHAHDGGHDNSHAAEHSHTHDAYHDYAHDLEPAHVHDAEHSHAHGTGASATSVEHRHGWGRPHSHAVPDPQGGPITLGSLLALGISGGLLPCPAALVVLLAAISFHNVALGMLLVAAFSVGLAVVLTAIGLLVVYGGRLFGRTPLAARLGGSRLAGTLPVLSAVAITVAGLAIATQAARALV